MERTKFNVDKDTEKRTFDGIVFDSQMEMRFYRDVVLPQSRSGVIKSFELQKKYILQPKFHNGKKTVQPIVYVADFLLNTAMVRLRLLIQRGVLILSQKSNEKCSGIYTPKLHISGFAIQK